MIYVSIVELSTFTFAHARLLRMVAFRLRVVGTLAAAVSGGSVMILCNPPTSENDSGSGPALESFRRKIADPAAAVPSREVQRSSLMGSSAVKPLDLLVIGGGATGSGVALDAACRGLSVGLVEREDFSSGTSSRSTKLIHGGKVLFNSFGVRCR